jgi:hypothetical protein
MAKEMTHIPPDEGSRSLWVMGELLTQRSRAGESAGLTHTSRSPRSPVPDGHPTSSTVRTSSSTCSRGTTGFR